MALVGCGYWGAHLARNVAACPKATLAALCDSALAAVARVGLRFPGNIKRCTDLNQVLADPAIEAVLIATPSGLHHRHALAALEARKHVFVEKPLAMTSAEARELIRAARNQDRTLMVGHTFLYNNIVHEVKRRIDSGELGKVYYAYSQRLNLGRFRRDSDVLWTLAPHDLSILNYLFDGRPSRVAARGRAFIHANGVAELAFADLEYPGGRSAHLHMSWLDPQKRREMVIVGSERMLVYDDMNADAHIRLYDKKAEAEHQRDPTDFADFTTRLRAGDLVIPNIRLVEPVAAEVEHFADCVREGKAPVTDGRHGLDVILALESLSRSMA